MLSKNFYLLVLIVLALVLVVGYYNSITNSSGDSETFRQILQAHQEVSSDSSDVNLPYVRVTRNDTGNLPEVYLDDKAKKPGGVNKTCAKFPDFFSLRFRNDHWQIQSTSIGTFHLFNAYLDERNGSVVRIVGTYDVHKPTNTFFCQFWYQKSQKPKIVESQILYWMFHPKWGADTAYFNHPYLITCPVVLDSNNYPVSVSLVEKECDFANNNLKIFHKTVKEKKNFVVCVKGLSFPYQDKSARFAEWIELLNILGAEKINFYEFNVHPNIQKLLDYYVDQGLVEVTPLTLVGDVSNDPVLQGQYLRKRLTQRRLEEVIPFTDCLYKHLQEFKYVVLLDTDEIIVPANNTWIELLDNLTVTFPNATSFLARNVYFMDTYLHQHDWFEGIPKEMHMLQHVYRAVNYTKPGYFVKGFHDTSRVAALHNHFPFTCVWGCKHREMDVSLAHLQHYRADCASGVSDCKSMRENSIVDKRVWNYKDELMRRVDKTFRELNFVYS